MSKIQLTILTDPSPTLKYKFKKIFILIKQLIKQRLWFLFFKDKKNIPVTPQYGGHFAVTRSIIEGLKQININFNYNPKNIKDIAETIYIPGGIESLKYGIRLKKYGFIKKIIAGPNIVVTPNELINICDYDYINLYLQPSDWVVNWWKNLQPNMPIKIESWCAGVNIDFWKPTCLNKNKNKILIYKKFVPENLFSEIKNLLQENNFEIEIINYGSYTPSEYLEALNRNSYLIHLTESESQGISLAEAWSTNTPTFVWNPTITMYNNIVIENCSSAPYLSEKTGKYFRDISELKNIFLRWNPDNYEPRKWVLDNMSDKVCAKTLLSIINK
jgi:glycosyltransferase involved in cell wall biosynthesis